jgi:hypothetical protein
MRVRCDFCELPFPLDAFDDHAQACGNRTDVCEACNSYVRLCDFARHRASGCAVGATASALPPGGTGESAPLLPRRPPDAPYHRERLLRLAEPEIPRWAPFALAAVGVGVAVALSAVARRR